MKLAIVRQRYTPFGGAERFVAGALDTLRSRGVDVEIIARQWTEGDAGVECNPFYLGRTWRDRSFARCVQRVIASERYDIVQSHERIPGCHVYRAGDGIHATWLELARKPLTWLSPWHRYTLAAEAAMLRHPNLQAVICNSRMVRDDIARRFPQAAEKLHVIYSGVDPQRFHPALCEEHRSALRKKVGAGEAAPIILYVGSGFARKGVATLIEALARMATSNAEVWIVGQDKEAARYRRLAQQLGVDSRIRFFGAQTDVRPFYGAADIFCLPTLYDPFPNAALEALACGLPVVTTATCGAAELIETGRNGWVCPPRDPAALADALETLSRPGVSEVMRGSAHASTAPLTPVAMAEQLTALYARLIESTAFRAR
ncbi:MAG: glycosyltransferase family 4 protein [Rhodocyclaceae bacterium]|nr:glycosyltransferase family 4 protein [Rhodocyclaceae bacterium]MDZ4215931.1 glycosyltransferase family 4 protein [Rhodocyclaceae bacterium]